MVRNLGVAIAVVAFVFVGVMGGGSAVAETADSAAEQRDRTFRLYEHDDQGGGVEIFRSSDQYLGDRSWDDKEGPVNNNASSMENDLLRQVILWDTGSPGGTGCRGDYYLAQPTSVDDDLTNNDFDNKASCVIFG